METNETLNIPLFPDLSDKSSGTGISTLDFPDGISILIFSFLPDQDFKQFKVRGDLPLASRSIDIVLPEQEYNVFCLDEIRSTLASGWMVCLNGLRLSLSRE